jgi:aspartate/methionine/tyrosine aminotransferase
VNLLTIVPQAAARPRPEAQDAPSSGIVEVMSYGRNREGIIPLWVGEGDLKTPDFICEAATRSLNDGETFYTWQRGIPPLREALAAYNEGLYGAPVDPDRFYVTAGGMHAAQIAIRIVCGTGDEVLIPTPAWPNFAGAIGIVGAQPVSVPMIFGPEGWSLDWDRLEASVTPRSRAIVINSPANPTGWTATRDDLGRILELARRHKLWIIADEIYGRFVYDEALMMPGRRTPSFKDIISPKDRVMFVQTFSKNWAMTGWRVGWLEAPPSLGPMIENLIQYSTSGVAAFLQRGALAAIAEGEAFVQEQIARAHLGRDVICDGLRSTGIVDLPMPSGAFYAFFRIQSVSDTRALALRLVDEANVGLAPGSAFGEGGGAHLRLCFARRLEDLHAAVERLKPALARIIGEGLNAAVGPVSSRV